MVKGVAKILLKSSVVSSNCELCLPKMMLLGSISNNVVTDFWGTELIYIDALEDLKCLSIKTVQSVQVYNR